MNGLLASGSTSLWFNCTQHIRADTTPAGWTAKQENNVQQSPLPMSAADGLRRQFASQPTRSGRPDRYRPSDLAQRVRGLGPLARTEDVTLSVQTADHADESRSGDRDRLLQLTTSLVSLAVRSSRHGNVCLRVESPPDAPVRLILSFADLSKAPLGETLLWSGNRRSRATLQSVIKAFVAELGAEVGIAAGLRERTELCITLPQEPAAKGSQRLDDRRVLLVGDAKATSDSLSALLVAHGAEVSLQAEAGHLRRQDAMIVDIDSVDDAASTLFRLREAERLQGRSAAPALALVDAEATPEDIVGYFCAGFAALAFKPICIDEICRKLNSLL
ncbi:MAG: hypothetical protein JG765_1781 [Cereibacter sp.]|jgi:hypothetical protein|nr:hypothetical protein [Cereibacter sp.]